MTGPVEGDKATYDPVGTWDTVPGVLRSLGVDGKPKDVQRKAVQRFWALPTTRVLLRKIERNLRNAGLL
jgi:hypothetical protein